MDTKRITSLDSAFDKVISLFSVLGYCPKAFHLPGFKYVEVPGWRTPSFSPLMLEPGHNLVASNLNLLKDYYWTQGPVSHHSIESSPYFNFINDPDLYDYLKVESVCQQAGWIIDSKPLRLNFLVKSLSLTIPDDWHYSIGNSFNWAYSDAYIELLMENFSADEEYIDLVQTALCKGKADSYTVMIHNQKMEPIAGGSVSINDGWALMTWGAVNPAFRKQGVHAFLLAACKTIASAHGADYCGYATRNPSILNKSDTCIELYICRKKI